MKSFFGVAALVFGLSSAVWAESAVRDGTFTHDNDPEAGVIDSGFRYDDRGFLAPDSALDPDGGVSPDGAAAQLPPEERGGCSIGTAATSSVPSLLLITAFAGWFLRRRHGAQKQ